VVRTVDVTGGEIMARDVHQGIAAEELQHPRSHNRIRVIAVHISQEKLNTSVQRTIGLNRPADYLFFAKDWSLIGSSQ